ncbi:Transglutaminase-like superfamily protein [Bremerella volcania]|uniref:Transglutaminase-like superfamily protein n=1 Tax=Bremerella volcania TaxID=2527984 RepID=A0A518C6A8_9BACT|nr:transglutaminase-like domain-containing protein [Bremerella volcania]QDU74753.1 Transglutaminase-like superfamily protein [Bremerella volcania]
MANTQTTMRLQWLTLASAIAGVTAANVTIFDKLGTPIALAISAGWGLGIWLLFTLASRFGRDQTTARHPYFPPIVQATIMCAALAIPVVRVFGFGADERIDALLMESLRNLCATSAIFTFDPIRRRATLFIGLLLVLFSFTLESSLAVTICTLAELIIMAFWLSANESLPWETDGRYGATRWKPDFVITCTLLVLTGFAVTFFIYSDKERKVDKSLDSLARQKERRVKSDFSFQKEEEEIAIDHATNKKHGEDAEGSSQGKDEAKRRAHREQFREFSTIRSAPSENQDFEKLFSLDTTQVRHIPSTHYEQFNGKQWLAEKKSQLPAMTAQIADQQGLSKLLNADDLDYSKITQNLDITDENFLEQARTAIVKAMADQGAGTMSPDLSKISPSDLQRLMQSHPEWANEASLVVTHYELQALAEQMKSDPQLLWKFLATTRGNEYRQSSVLSKLRQWREAQEGPFLPDELAALVQEWTDGTDPGWEEIMGVVNGLRNHAEYDPQATIPAGETDSVFYFLVESKRGPDYLFASSAVVLLRSLGYPTRLVGGYYANENKRSWLTGNVAIEEDDVHYWAQVKLDDRVWVDIEPTPGFDIPSANDQEQATIALTVWNFLADHGVRIAGVLICVLVLAKLVIRPLESLIFYLLWRYWPWQTPREIVHKTQRLLRNRFKTAGIAPHAGQSFANCVLRLDPQQDCLQRYHTLGQQAIYHDDPSTNSTLKQELRKASREVVAWATPGRLKDTVRALDSAS